MAEERDGRKLTFSERDKRRRDGRRDDRRDSGQPPGTQKAYRAALERAFDSGTVNELAAEIKRVSMPNLSGQPAPETPEPLSDNFDTATSVDDKPPSADELNFSQRRKLATAIREAISREAISKAADRYVNVVGSLPDDVETLTKLLEHERSNVLLATLDRLIGLLGAEKPRRSRSLAAQLQLLEETHGDPDVRARAAQVRALL